MLQGQLYGIEIDYSRDSLIAEHGMVLLKEFYFQSGEVSPQEAFARAASAYSAGDTDLAQRMYDYASKGWLMFSTPILSNAVRLGEQWKGLPISCYLSYTDDTLESLIEHSTEIRWLSVKGGGVAGHWSSVRSVSRKAPGPIPFLKTIDADMTAYHQGQTRRGSYAAYLDISHPDIVEFINLRTPTGGDANRKTLNLHHGVNITDSFMNALTTNGTWDLIDPHDKTIRDTVSARELWQLLLETRCKTGEPYLCFIDTANKALPSCLQEKGFLINGSNLCTEIMLPTSEARTAVCCLLSLNCEYFDEWASTSIVQDAIRFLDNVLQVFIDNAPPELYKAVLSATQERALGLGLMGWHSYLQRLGVPFESALATGLNHKVSSLLQREAIASTKQLAVERGEYPDGIGSGRRNSHLLAIAPNANSAFIVGASPSTEVWKSNAFTAKTRAGSHLIKNKYLDKLLVSKIPDLIERESVWSSIINNQGSVQHLEMLDDWEKLIFKTAFEIDQNWIIEHASTRQIYICQGQSINLFFPAGTERAYINRVHLKAWKAGLKSLYYLRTSAQVSPDNINKQLLRVPLADYIASTNEECLSCHS